MPKRKKERGRPMKRPYPSRVDATPEAMAQAMFAMPADHQWEYPNAGAEGPEYRCTDCKKAVHYPDTLYQDGRCETCHAAVAA